MKAGRDRRLVTAALVLGLFLAALEATAVGTAMPTVVAELGGVTRYSWVFSAYLLASTTTVPMYGKLADLYGRRRIYLLAVGLFILGAALSGTASTFAQLVAYRAIQGLGAGGVMPISVTLIGDLYTLEERGRMQGLFSGVWGVSSLLGPVAGGLITDSLSWRWVFYINIPFGIVSAVMLRAFLREETRRREHRLDILGTAILTGAIAILLLALLEGSEIWGWRDPRTFGMILLAVAGLALFLWQERRAPEPMLPLDLFRSRVIAASSAGSVVIGTLLFCASAFVPMFAQGVLGGTGVDAGLTLAPMTIGWPIASTLAGWLLLRVGYRPLAIVGAAAGVIGGLLLAAADSESGRGAVMLAMLVTGLGLGFMATPYLVAVQNAVPWHRRGVATSSVQFFRTIGGAITVSAFGALLNVRLAQRLGPGFDADIVLHPELRKGIAPSTLRTLVDALENGLTTVYLALAGVALLGLAAALLFPGGSAASHAHREARREEAIASR
ncbi:MAG: MFS transporter [Gemmatimonadetes bacterium]|nr:MFS transporter [Gemmatimonadota bacterium]